MADYDAIVVGGGHNGLVAAFYLARAGRRVCVLERRPFVGGACATEELFPGYLVSSCSYIVWNLQEKVVVDMDLARHGFVRTPVDPLPVLPLRGNEYLAFWADEERTKAEVGRVNARDAERYSDWLHFWYRAAGLVHPFFLREPPTSAELREHARAIGEEALLDKLLAASIADIAAEYLTDPRVAAAQVLICDVGDPYAPGSAWSEAWWHTNEHNGSVPSVVRGGMGAITRAMASAVTEQGGEIRTDAAVERILVENGRAAGVRLSGGQVLTSDVILSNADPKRTFLRLLGPEDLPATFRAQIEQISTRAAYLKFHAILDRPLDLSDYIGEGYDPRYSTYVTIAPDGFDTYRRAWQQAQRGEVATEPVCHIQVPTAYDDSLTNAGGEVVSIWVMYAPVRPTSGTWDHLREPTAHALIDWVTQFIPNFRSDMRQWQLMTPADIEAKHQMTDGNIRHIDMIPGQLYGDRPLPGAGYDTPIAGLYLCGNGTHPGGEVTGAPGHNAAHHILGASPT